MNILWNSENVSITSCGRQNVSERILRGSRYHIDGSETDCQFGSSSRQEAIENEHPTV